MHSALDLIQALDELFGATTGERASLEVLRPQHKD